MKGYGCNSWLATIGVSIALISILAFLGLWPAGQAHAQADTRILAEQAKTRTDEVDSDTVNPPPSAAEARIRARMLHEAFQGALQVMHRDFFREDEKLTLPAKSLEDVFQEMARRQNVHLRWIAVNTKAMSVAHLSKTDFEKAAVKALASGKPEFESVENDLYYYAGPVRLSAHCLKCHAPKRTSNDDRTAGLIITMPLGNR